MHKPFILGIILWNLVICSCNIQTAIDIEKFSGQSDQIADYRVVDLYEKIPAEWLAKVKEMLVSYPGESHGRGLLYGLALLEAGDKRYAVNPTWTGAPPATGNQALRITRAYWNGITWDGWTGEEDFWSSDEAIANMDGWLRYAKDSLQNKVQVFAFGWCYDMSWEELANGWAGAVYWPKDRSHVTSPWDIATTKPCLNDYLAAVAHYNQANPTTITLYTTGPVDGQSYNTGERGYQRALKNEAIREWVRNDKSRWLFDYASILCYGATGTRNTVSWEGHGFEYLHDDYYGNYDGGDGDCHINEKGCLRLAKAMWWLLARIAGWDWDTGH